MLNVPTGPLEQVMSRQTPKHGDARTGVISGVEFKQQYGGLSRLQASGVIPPTRKRQLERWR